MKSIIFPLPGTRPDGPEFWMIKWSKVDYNYFAWQVFEIDQSLARGREGNENSLGSPLRTPGHWLENYRQSVRRLSTRGCWSAPAPIGFCWRCWVVTNIGHVHLGERTSAPPRTAHSASSCHVSSILCVRERGRNQGLINEMPSNPTKAATRAHTSHAPLLLTCYFAAVWTFWQSVGANPLSQSEPQFLLEKIKELNDDFSDGQKAPLIDNIRPSEDWWAWAHSLESLHSSELSSVCFVLLFLRRLVDVIIKPVLIGSHSLANLFGRKVFMCFMFVGQKMFIHFPWR